MKINFSDCSWEDLVKLARKCGFLILEGGKHTKVEDKTGKFITTIPRKNKLNKHTVRGIISEFRMCGCDIDSI